MGRMAGNRPHAQAAAIKAHGGVKVTAMRVDTRRGWPDHRIELESTALEWLAGLN